jgi:hypothetical protein
MKMNLSLVSGFRVNDDTRCPREERETLGCRKDVIPETLFADGSLRR